MKKWILLFLVLLLLPVFVYAENCNTSNITITSIKKINSSGYTEEIEEPSTDNTSVSTNLKLYDVGDSITYEIKVKNKSNKDYDLNKKIGNSEYVSYEIISNDNKIKANEEKTIDLKVEYKKKVPDNLYKSNLFIENKQIELIVEDYIINPSTGRNIIITLLIIMFVVLSILSIKKDLKYKSLLLLLFIPLFVEASCEYILSINSRIEFKKILPNPCTYEGELVPGAEYTNGQYTYKYKQEYNYYYDYDYDMERAGWVDISHDGWGVILTDKESTDSVTTKLCTSINNIPIVSMSLMFQNSLATTLDLSSFDTSNVTNMESMFGGSQVTSIDLSNFDTSNVIDMSSMFARSYAASLNLSSFDTKKVTNMSNMFGGSQAISIDLSSFDTSNVTDMNYMFSSSRATNLDLSNFDTSSVVNMKRMFIDNYATSLDLSSFDTSNVTNMEGMFYESRATTLNLSNFNTSNVTDMMLMFCESQAISLDLSSFDTGKVTRMYGMFENSKMTTIDLSSFDTSNVLYMNYMFAWSQATTGYGKTQADCDKFNASSNKPPGLTFVVKGS